MYSIYLVMKIKELERDIEKKIFFLLVRVEIDIASVLMYFSLIFFYKYL